jgi:hypothetical protein
MESEENREFIRTLADLGWNEENRSNKACAMFKPWLASTMSERALSGDS